MNCFKAQSCADMME